MKPTILDLELERTVKKAMDRELTEGALKKSAKKSGVGEVQFAFLARREIELRSIPRENAKVVFSILNPPRRERGGSKMAKSQGGRPHLRADRGRKKGSRRRR